MNKSHFVGLEIYILLRQRIGRDLHTDTYFCQGRRHSMSSGEIFFSLWDLFPLSYEINSMILYVKYISQVNWTLDTVKTCTLLKLNSQGWGNEQHGASQALSPLGSHILSPHVTAKLTYSTAACTSRCTCLATGYFWYISSTWKKHWRVWVQLCWVMLCLLLWLLHQPGANRRVCRS